MERVLLIDVDALADQQRGRKRKRMPNIALMKISAWHKQNGDQVSWNEKNPTIVYASVIFTENNNYLYFLQENYPDAKIHIGGSGHSFEELPHEIDQMFPDYSIYNTLSSIGFTCYSKDTEILTKKGWKYFKDLTKLDYVATLNPINHHLEYQKPTEIVCEEYSGELLYFKNKYIDILVTPNHRMYVSSMSDKYKLRTAEEIKNLYQYKFKKDTIWIGREKEWFYLPNINSDPRQKTKEKIKMDDWLEFMGYYLSEWNTQLKHKKSIPNSKMYLVKISQMKKSQCYNAIKQCIKRLGYNMYMPKHGDFYISNKQLYTYLKEFGKSYEKYVPNFIKELSPRQIEIFFSAYVDGDGVRYKRKRNEGYCEGIISSSKRIVDDFQELLLKMGYCGDIKAHNQKNDVNYMKVGKRFIISKHDSYHIFKNEFYSNPIHYNKTKSIYYKDKVYCCIVPNGIIYIRRNGVGVWCGNTRGCIRKCKFCIVEKKEGKIHPYMEISQFHDPKHKKVVLLDNNIFALKDWFKKNMEYIKEHNLKVDFNQGLDIRLLDDELINILKGIRYQELRFAWDTMPISDIVKEKIKLIENNFTDLKHKSSFYILVEFDTNIIQDLERVHYLREKEIPSYIMPYQQIYKNQPKPIRQRHTKSLERYCNRRDKYFKYKDYWHYLTSEYSLSYVLKIKQEYDKAMGVNNGE